MKYLKKRRLLPEMNLAAQENPLDGVANLFDMSVVFIVGLFLALLSMYGMSDLVNEKSEVSIVKKSANGQMEIITKKGKEITVERVSDRKAGGTEVEKLGTAYRLKDGRKIYVPE
jgi:hypothetical protein